FTPSTAVSTPGAYSRARQHERCPSTPQPGAHPPARWRVANQSDQVAETCPVPPLRVSMAASRAGPTPVLAYPLLALQLRPQRTAHVRRPYDPSPMRPEQTTALVQRYLDRIAGDTRAETLVRELLARAVQRLHRLCANLLHRSYSRLAKPPLNLQAEE